MTITDNQLKGNWAEQYIASCLASQGCLIRHVTQGHDSGIDLYCETIVDGNPFLHFWCQIKTSKKWKGKRDHLIFPTDKRHKEYWLNKPVPVFIFLVPDLREKLNIPFYICNAIDLLLGDKIKSSYKLATPEDLKNFLEKELRLQTFLWDLKEGKVSYLKDPEPGYFTSIPPGYTPFFEDKLSTSLRNTLWLLSEDIIVGNQPNLNNQQRASKAKPYVMTLETFVKLKQDKHWENYFTIGNYYRFEGNYNKALMNYKESLKIINDDPNVDQSRPPWLVQIKVLEYNIRDMEKNIHDSSAKK